MPPKKKKSNRGGKRAGAGRKAKPPANAPSLTRTAITLAWAGALSAAVPSVRWPTKSCAVVEWNYDERPS